VTAACPYAPRPPFSSLTLASPLPEQVGGQPQVSTVQPNCKAWWTCPLRPLNARAVQRTQRRTDIAASRSQGKRSWLAAAHQGGARRIVLLEVSRVLRLQVVPDCDARAQPPGQPRCARTAHVPASRQVDEPRSCPTGGNRCICRSWGGARAAHTSSRYGRDSSSNHARLQLRSPRGSKQGRLPAAVRPGSRTCGSDECQNALPLQRADGLAAVQQLQQAVLHGDMNLPPGVHTQISGAQKGSAGLKAGKPDPGARTTYWGKCARGCYAVARTLCRSARVMSFVAASPLSPQPARQ